uniref:Hemolysins and related proteins containing cbs domains n=1 Tax=uncultured Spirochaetales bacterium HF0500_06B09 TaxID=710994 RepID=E0XY93_9SPIR|nr:hemolysins and related proteins containing cbs domains [uncultured Spirochaetales bacterium HF0500_06B09]
MVMVANRIAMLVARGRPVVRVSRGEIRAIAGLGRSQGVIAEDESRMIESVITFGSLAVRDVMTPRPVVVALDESLNMDEAADADLRPSRILIYQDNIDSVTGYILRYDLLLAVARGDGKQKVESLRRDIHPLPDALSLRDAFSKLMSRREHIALIVDQYGGTAGIVTLEDIVETLLGLEIVDETDRATDMQELARRLWAARVRRRGLSVSDKGTTESPPSDRAPIGRHGDAGADIDS